MNKPLYIFASLAIIFVMGLLLFWPATYQLAINNSRYFEPCGTGTRYENECEAIDPPAIETHQEPLIIAWWNKNQTERQYTQAEVETQWVDAGGYSQTQARISILSLLANSLGLLVYLAVVAYPIMALLQASRMQGEQKTLWLLMILFLFPFGVIAFLIVKPHKKPTPSKNA